MSDPLIKAHIFDGFEAFCASKGVDFTALLASSGLSPADIEDGTADVPLNAAADVLTRVADACGDPCFGLHWAQAFPRGAASILGYLLGNAKSVREGIRTIVRYVTLHLDPVEVAFNEHEDGGSLEWRFPATFTAPRVQYTSFVMALIVINLRRYIGATWSPKGVDLEHRALACSADVARILGPNVRFDCPVNALHLRETVLNIESAAADQRLFEHIRSLGDRLMAERNTRIDIVEATRRAIIHELEAGRSTLEAVAERLDTPPRQLQSRLSAESITFDALLQDTRRGLAETMLRDSDLPLTEIALLLGFSELSAFTRAATRWFGTAPRLHRNDLRRGLAEPTRPT
jgi:AraC-like DNA-binding protein